MAHSHEHRSTDRIRTAFFLNLLFTVIEIVGGLWTNSLAILSDAVHDLGDSLSLGLTWGLERYSRRGEDSRYSYGYRRFSLLGALFTAVVLLVGTFVILAQAVPRIIDPEPAHAPGMLLIAAIGILVNGAAVLRLRGAKTTNARVVAWHLLEDVLGWVAVLIVGLILLVTDWYVLDPVLSILIGIFVLYNVVRVLREALALFLQAVPVDLPIGVITDELGRLPNVDSLHHTHVWSLDGEHHVLTTHVVVGPDTTREQAMQLKRDIQRALEPYQFEHVTLEIEYGEDDCAMGAASVRTEELKN